MILRTAKFHATDGDRLIMVSDGITQSGQRTGAYRFGWGDKQLSQFTSFILDENPTISADDLACQIISKSNFNDEGSPADDSSCAVVNFRRPRSMMLVSCPPSIAEETSKMTDLVNGFEGERVICGVPVARLVAKSIGQSLETDNRNMDPSQPPLYHLHGFEMVTDGILATTRVLDLLDHSANTVTGNDTAARLTRMILRHDIIRFVIGIRRKSDQHGILPDEFVIRRNILRQIITLLETKWGKQVQTIYI